MAMFESIDFRMIMSFFAALASILGFVLYAKNIFALKTKPHIYTWAVWILTQGTAAVALVYGGGGWAALGMFVGVAVVTIVFLLSFKYGTTNIRTTDTIALVTALVAIIIWWQLNNPLLAVLMVSTIDGIGYIPTFRKTFEEPSTETRAYWFYALLNSSFSILALAEFNMLTLSYLITITVANAGMWFMLLVLQRKSFRSNPNMYPKAK